MSSFNKSYRIRTEIGKDTQLHVNLDRKYKTLEIMSLKINQENAYKLHSSNYGVIAGRVLANEAFGIPNAKISVFINIDNVDIYDPIKSVLYPYNTTYSKDKNGVRYNLFPNEQINNCHTIIGTFTEKQYMLDNNSTLEIFDKYYKFTTRTNNAGDYMIFGVPVGSQTIHVDIDLSDIGILSQKPRDMVYKGYNIEQFENPNKFKYDTNLESLTQVISQDNVTEVIPFWGDESENTIGITRCDINVQYKFEPTCVFMGSVVSDTASNGFSKKCIPTPGMGSMEEITTGSGTIEMIRKTPSGDVEEFQIKGTQLINGDGVWCYQIPMNLDYMMTDEFGNTVPTNDPEKGIPTRTRVRFRISMQDFDSDSVNMFRGKMLVPHNPDIYSDNCEYDYQFGTYTKEESYRDLFWNGVYSVKSYIPRIQKGSNWKNEKFTGFKRVNYYGDKNPIPYNNIRIRIPFMYMILCVLIKFIIGIVAMLNWCFNLISKLFIGVSIDTNDKEEDSGDKKNGGLITLSGELCDENLDNLCIIPGVDIYSIAEGKNKNRKTILITGILNFIKNNGGNTTSFDNVSNDYSKEAVKDFKDKKSIDSINSNRSSNNSTTNDDNEIRVEGKETGKKDPDVYAYIYNIIVTDKIDYLIECIEMNLAQEFKVIQFDFYNDWINGLIYIPRWMRIVTKKKSFLWGAIRWGGKVKACNENYTKGKRNIVQQCGLSYDISSNQITTKAGCTDDYEKLRCHKSTKVRLKYPILNNDGIVHSVETLKSQYVYYFKPFDGYEGKNVRLYATDIILLGTLNDCDIWGIPNNINELVSSTYQMPPNLALTDSDLEGNIYKTINISTGEQGGQKDGKFIAFDIDYNETYNKTKVTGISLNRCYSSTGGLTPSEETGNYTEISGVNWNYEGPLQQINDSDKNNYKIFKPGGHFLGISCRNSETNIKTCVNLSRICEYGVWMSQRHELNIQSDNEGEFTEYATIPLGLISKDEISDSNYRRLFATMNNNKLKTKINKETGYPIYDFIYLNPTNFNGELFSEVSGNNALVEDKNKTIELYNGKKCDTVTEKYYEFTDDDYTKFSGINIMSFDNTDSSWGNITGGTDVESFKVPGGVGEIVKVTETQIRRTGEYLDEEYYKFRFGLLPTKVNIKDEREKRFLLKNGNDVSFPMYDNSFYFYFGLHDGKTALDEFKKNYYAVCESINSLVQEDNNINLKNLRTKYNSVCDKNDGEISFNITTNDNFFNGSGIEVTVKDEIGDIKNTTILNNNNKENGIICKGLKEGKYTINVICIDNKKINKSFNVEIKQININAKLKGVDFYQDMSNYKDWQCFLFGESKHDRVSKYGGFIIIKDNLFEIDDNPNNKTSKSVYAKYDYVSEIIIKDKETNKKLVYNNHLTPYNFNYVNMEGNPYNNIDMNENGEYIIPVPYYDKVYSVYISTFMRDCRPTIYDDKITETYEWYIGDIEIKNGKPLDIKYNNISYKNIIKNYIDLDKNNKEWWRNTDLYVLEDDYVLWQIKKNLYQNNLDKPHKVIITNEGGIAPYTEIVTGVKEDLLTTNVSRSDFEYITIPTINYVKNGYSRRDNFSYQIKDKNETIAPEVPFLFPVIYKPFFMEMNLMYFNGINKCFIEGNIYNGIIWGDYKKGFNNVKLNELTISDFGNTYQYVAGNDNQMTINEPFLTDDVGGYDYKGNFYNYNGRKTEIVHEINSNNYNVYTDGSLFKFDLSVDSKTTYNNSIYSDSTSISYKNLEFINFKIETLENNDITYLRFINNKITNYNYKMYYIYVNETDNYSYKYVKNSTTNEYKYDFSNTYWFRSFTHDFIDKDCKESNGIYYINCSDNEFKTSIINGITYIDINTLKGDNYDGSYKLYCIGVYNNNNSADVISSNKESKLKVISISELIDLSNY